MMQKSDKELYIVGLGASAGGFEALLKFLKKVEPSDKLCYVIVQHLDPKKPTMLGDLLSKYTSLPISEITPGTLIQSNNIYFCPPNKNVTLKQGCFVLTQPDEKAYPKPSINKFFDSLALEKKDKAIAVVLSGTGSDGAKGIESVFDYGGITLAEDEGAKYFSMPKAAIDTGKVNVILPPELIAEGIPHVIEDRNYFATQYQIKSSIYKIFELLNQKTNIDFSSYKQNTILRRIKKRISETKSKDTKSYLKLLYSDEKEVENLKNELLIIVTSFFRGEDAFENLHKNLFELIEAKEDNHIRIWVPACATGEEAYTIAIIVSEILEKLKQNKKVTIFATDISSIAVESARKKSYLHEQMEDVKKEYVEKYFVEKSTGYRPVKNIRDMIIFSEHDIIKDPPFSNLDLISCRNLLIYFNSDLQKMIINLFHYSLKFGGLLFLGQSETVGSLSTLFSTINGKDKLYKKTNDIAMPLPETLSFYRKTVAHASKKDETNQKISDIDFSISKAIFQQYGQNGVVVDGVNNQVLFFRGDTKHYFTQPGGIVTYDLFKLIDEKLKLDLRSVLNESKRGSKFAISKQIKLSNEKSISYIRLLVFPLEANKLGDNTYYIAFVEDNVLKSDKKHHIGEGATSSDVSILEDELSSLKERLQITIEELETSNEELQSTNEELQSTNEELQSTNEELETSNEELQSTNEELQTVNDELSFKNEELQFTQIAFDNVLDSLKTDVLITDSSLNILKFTKGMHRFFDLTKSNIMNLSSILLHSTIEFPDLLRDLKDCLQNEKEIGYEVTLNKKIFWFRVKRINVFSNNVKDIGLAISFFDKTELFEKGKLLQEQAKLAAMGEMMNAVAHQWRQPLNALSINIQNLDDDFEEGLIDQEFIQGFIHKQTDTISFMSKTINDFKNFFKTDKEKKYFTMNSIVEKIEHLIGVQLRNHNIELKVEGDEFEIHGYESEMQQVMLNLITNSKDAIMQTNQSGVINVKLEPKEKKVVVCDSGGGVKEDILNKIFEPYFTTKGPDKGTGIGLHISRTIVVNHMGGDIHAYNKENGLCIEISFEKGIH